MYTDAGLSAKKDSERPELQRLFDDAAAGKFDVIVVDKIDRFFRHLGGLLVALDQLNAWSVSFASVQERLDFTTPWGKITLTVLGMLAEIYDEVIHFRTRGVINYTTPKPITKDTVQELLQKVFYTGQVPNYGDGRKHRGNNPPEIFQKRLIRLGLESVFLRGDAIVGVQPTPAFLPLLTFGASLQAEGGEFKVNAARFVHLNPIPLDQ